MGYETHSLRLSRKPSPTDDEAEAIWEAAKMAPPLFPELNLPPVDLSEIDSPRLHEADEAELPVNFQLGPGQRAIIKDTQDVAGNRQSVLLVYEVDDENSDSMRAENANRLSPVVDYPPPPRSSTPSRATPLPKRKPVPASIMSPKAPVSASNASKAQTPSPSPTGNTHMGKGKAKARAGLYKLRHAFKLTAFSGPSISRSKQQSSHSLPTENPVHLPKVRPVQLPASGAGQRQPVQPVPRKTVGHPDRMTAWGDLSQYKAEEEVPSPSPVQSSQAEVPPRRRPAQLRLDKPLPDLPPPGSHLRYTRAPEGFSNRQQSSPAQRGRTNRRTAVYAGSVISTPDLSEDSDTSPSDSSAHTPLNSTHAHDGVIHRLAPPGEIRQGRIHPETPYGSPHFNYSVNDEIGRLRNTLARPFDPDDEDDKSPMVDTFVHDKHTSFLITERLDENSVRSLYGVQDRIDGDAVDEENDPAKALWGRLEIQVGGGGWSGK